MNSACYSENLVKIPRDPDRGRRSSTTPTHAHPSYRMAWCTGPAQKPMKLYAWESERTAVELSRREGGFRLPGQLMPP